MNMIVVLLVMLIAYVAVSTVDSILSGIVPFLDEHLNIRRRWLILGSLLGWLMLVCILAFCFSEVLK